MTTGRFQDFALPLLVLAAAIAGLFFWVDTPAEAALVLYRYSENLAHYFTIVYNPATEQVEGAPDFLWMVTLAVFYGLGIPIFTAAHLLSLASLIGMRIIFYKLAPSTNRTRFTCGIMTALLLLAPFWSAASGFSTYYFGFWLLHSAYGFIRNHASLMLWAGLTACLVRPGGLIFIAPLVLLAFAQQPVLLNNRRYTLSLLACTALGTGYFLWRWQHFHLFIPLAFYIKSASAFVLPSLMSEAYLIALNFFILFYLSQARRHQPPVIQRKAITLMAAYVIAPLLFYATMDMSQNNDFRYHFPILLTFMLLAVLFYAPVAAKAFWLYLYLWGLYTLSHKHKI